MKTHCNHGHDLTPENTYVNAKGHRQCRACKRIQWRAWKDRVIERRPEVDPTERFWSKVGAADAGGCWPWLAGLDGGGYGLYRLDGNGRQVRAYRHAYELLVGDVPEGLVLDHLCRNRLCVNPDHLEPVTNKVNILRGFGAAAINARKTHCKRGHEFTPENSGRGTGGGRRCRTCAKADDRKWRLRRSEAVS